MGMQKAGVLLGVHGDGMANSLDTRGRARRILTPQSEYPIFTPGIRESVVLPPISDQGRISFQESDGQGVWKEIHTDNQSTQGHSSRSLSFETGHILTPSASVTSLDQHSGPLMLSGPLILDSGPLVLDSGPLVQDSGPLLQDSGPLLPDSGPLQHSGPLSGPLHKPSSRSSRAQYMESPAVLASPSSGGMLPASRIAMNSGSNYFISLPNTPGQRNYNISGRHASPAPTRTAAMSHSPQNVNILSPQLRPLEKSPKLTQLHISSPRLTDQGGMNPMVNQLTLSPDQGRSAYDLNDTRMLPNNMLPPASVNASSDPRGHVTAASPVHGSSSSTLRLKKLTKPWQTEQSPRPSVSKDRSWKKSFRAASPLASIRSGPQNSVRGLRKDMNDSFQGRKERGNAAASVDTTSLPSWRDSGDGGQAAIAPALDREISQDSSVTDFEPPDPPQKVGGKKVAPTQKSGTYNIFGFLNWGKRKTTGSSATTLHKFNESFQSDAGGSVNGNTDTIKVLDYTIKTLRYKLEQANQKCIAAEEEVRALQSVAVASDEKCRMLTQRCQDLELQLSARRSGLHWDLEVESDNATYIVGRREAHNPVPVESPQIARRFPSQDLTPEHFLKVFEGSQACIRKLASALCHHIRDSGESATQVITSLLEQHRVGRSISRMPRNVIILYFESFLNQIMFESFENVSFEPNGASSVFDPDTLKKTCYQAYQNLKNQEWVNIEKSLGKPGALVVNTSFHRFFVVRMELILSQLGKLAESEISISLMASFFNTVKAVWLVHHLAFSFDQPVSIFRVSPSAEFDPRFMEQIPAFEEAPVRSKISIMVNPGFIVNRQTIKCQVYCSSTYQ